MTRPRPRVIVEGAAPAIITDHKFRPKGQWWSLCAICNLAQSAHKETHKTTQKQIDKHFSQVPRASRE